MRHKLITQQSSLGPMSALEDGELGVSPEPARKYSYNNSIVQRHQRTERKPTSSGLFRTVTSIEAFQSVPKRTEKDAVGGQQRQRQLMSPTSRNHRTQMQTLANNNSSGNILQGSQNNHPGGSSFVATYHEGVQSPVKTIKQARLDQFATNTQTKRTNMFTRNN